MRNLGSKFGIFFQLFGGAAEGRNVGKGGNRRSGCFKAWDYLPSSSSDDEEVFFVTLFSALHLRVD